MCTLTNKIIIIKLLGYGQLKSATESEFYCLLENIASTNKLKRVPLTYLYKVKLYFRVLLGIKLNFKCCSKVEASVFSQLSPNTISSKSGASIA